MFSKLKNWLGIEGVKIELVVPEIVPPFTSEVEGKIRFYSQNNQTVTKVIVRLVERYSRGRGKSKLINEFVIGEIIQTETMEVYKGLPFEMDFKLPFERLKSDMDKFQDKNIIAGGLVKTAKLLRGVKSEFRIEAEAKVRDTALQPVATSPIKIK